MESSIAPSFNQRLYSDLNLLDMNSNQRLCSDLVKGCVVSMWNTLEI
jgi:hypothetical protein